MDTDDKSTAQDGGLFSNDDVGVTDNNNIQSSLSVTPSSSSSTLSDLFSPHFPTNDSEQHVYAFETDHVALKANKDYQNLLGVLITLESQRIQALKDMDTLICLQEEALEDPIQFVNKLQNKVNLGIPMPIPIAPLLELNWDNYTTVPEHLIGLRRQSIRIGGKNDNSDTGSVGELLQNHQEVESTSSMPIVVRGRVKVESKPVTFNQLWTVDEQKQLEDLLIKYPPEEVEAKRWSKIASALGNRTPIQVQSRIQKYFIKLTKAGLPVPGRIPRVQREHSKVSKSHRQQRSNHYLNQSTFLQSHQPPVYMSDDDETDVSVNMAAEIQNGNCITQNYELSDEEDIPVELRLTEEYRELMRLKRFRHIKQQQETSDNNMVKHTGYKCDRCAVNPICGTRWNCRDCPADVSVDLCGICVDSQFETSNHDLSHRLLPVRNPPSQSFVDRDYMKFAPNGYNYLDPNYMPAT